MTNLCVAVAGVSVRLATRNFAERALGLLVLLPETGLRVTSANKADCMPGSGRWRDGRPCTRSYQP